MKALPPTIELLAVQNDASITSKAAWSILFSTAKKQLELPPATPPVGFLIWSDDHTLEGRLRAFLAETGVSAEIASLVPASATPTVPPGSAKIAVGAKIPPQAEVLVLAKNEHVYRWLSDYLAELSAETLIIASECVPEQPDDMPENIIWEMAKIHVYGRKFRIWTDHQPGLIVEQIFKKLGSQFGDKVFVLNPWQEQGDLIRIAIG